MFFARLRPTTFLLEYSEYFVGSWSVTYSSSGFIQRIETTARTRRFFSALEPTYVRHSFSYELRNESRTPGERELSQSEKISTKLPRLNVDLC